MLGKYISLEIKLNFLIYVYLLNTDPVSGSINTVIFCKQDLSGWTVLLCLKAKGKKVMLYI